MRSRSVLSLIGTASLFALMEPRIAAAQPAQPSAAKNSELEEIVVTARRKEERVQTVPLAVTAFSQAAIDKQQIQEIHDLAQHVPSIGVSLSQSDSNALYSGQLRLRGLPGTEIYMADVPIGNADYQGGTGLQHGLSEGNLYDLGDVEIVKGPQGTLFGKNSVGGLISYQPQHPTNVFEGYLKTKFGNYNDQEVEGAVNIPIIEDKLMVRIAGQMQHRDGYTQELTQHRDLDNKDFTAWRIGVTFRPTDDIENYLMYDGYYQHTNGSGDIVSFLNPNFILSKLGPGFVPLPAGVTTGCVATVTLGGPAFGVGTGDIPGGCGNFHIGLYQQDLNAILAKQKALGPRAVIGDNFQKIGKDYFYGLTDVLTWDISDDITIKNIAAARIFKQLATDDYTPIGLPILNIGAPGNNQQWGGNSVQYTEEVQLKGRSLGGKLSWVVGGFVEFDHPLGDTLLASAALGNSAGGAVSYFHFNIQDRSQALFAHGDYSLDDYVEGLKFTAGYRYTWDWASTGARGLSASDTIKRNAAGTATNCTGVFLTDNNCFQATDAHFSSYGWNLGLEEQLDPNTLLYVRSGNAYKPGGSNLNVPADFAEFKPEHITDVELGVKADWDFMGIHGRTNADIFHSDYKAIQVQSLVTLTDAAGKIHTNTLNANAASATLEGAEFEGTFIPFTGLEITPHASYLWAKYDNYPLNFNPAGTSTPFLYFPKWSYGATVTYHLPIDESYGDIAVAATYSWYGHQYDTVSVGEVYTIEPHYELLDVRVDWTNIMGRPYDIGFWMKNALDTTYVQGAVPISAQLGFTSLTYNTPRMFGVTLKMRFGPDLDTGLGF